MLSMAYGITSIWGSTIKEERHKSAEKPCEACGFSERMRYTQPMRNETQQLAVEHLKHSDPKLRQVIEKVGELHYEVEQDGFAFLVQVIIGQMLSAKAADTIYARLAARLERDIDAARFSSLDEEQLRSLGIARRKAQTILALADMVAKNPSLLSSLASLGDKECLASLCRYKGIGPWTAKMYLMFVLDREDILPLEDGAFLQTYHYLYGDENIEARTSVWKPYRSLAARYLYRFLDLGYCS